MNKVNYVSPSKSEIIITIGNLYMEENGDIYILANVDYNKITLISLNQGERWTSPVTIIDPYNIHPSKLLECFGNNGKFTALPKNLTINISNGNE